MNLSDLDFILPAEQIAQSPLSSRAASRMLIVDRKGTIRDAFFTDLVEELGANDVLVLNNTKVFPARLLGHTSTGANVEIFLIEKRDGNTWAALAKPAKRLAPGKNVIFDENFSAVICEKLDGGRVILELESNGDINAAIDRVGKTPLPPYIHRADDDPNPDRERYQTVFASQSGAIAAPTAGLHFTAAILDRIKERGTQIVELTLHVGYGTFEPVRVEDLAEHSVLPERFSLSREAADSLNQALGGNKRIVAVGTTTTRALESAIAKHGYFIAGEDIADLTVRPGYEFRAVSALFTNFHLPKSSLLVLVTTFGGFELIMDAYRHAVREGYRFYSYGDCMLIK